MQKTRVNTLIVLGSFIVMAAFTVNIYTNVGVGTMLHLNSQQPDQYLQFFEGEQELVMPIARPLVNLTAFAYLNAGIDFLQSYMLVFNEVPLITCQACHPETHVPEGSEMAAPKNISCTDCPEENLYGNNSNHISWVNFMTCTNCHTQAFDDVMITHTENLNQKMIIYTYVDYISITAHNKEQSIRQQDHANSIVECELCHLEKSGVAPWRFGETE